jgi:hypothetical protein
MAEWQAVALGVKPKKKAEEYMDLKFVKQVVNDLGRK